LTVADDILLPTSNESRTNISGSVVNKTNEGDRNQSIDVLTDSYLVKVLSRTDDTSTTSHSGKKCPSGRAPKRPLVCIPCKKHFSRRCKLDQHNRLVHNTDVRYSCEDCDKTFSRRDHIARHVRSGHCTKQSTTGTEVSLSSDDSRLVELSMYTNTSCSDTLTSNFSSTLRYCYLFFHYNLSKI